jgi:hypothetical protein
MLNAPYTVKKAGDGPADSAQSTVTQRGRSQNNKKKIVLLSTTAYLVDKNYGPNMFQGN